MLKFADGGSDRYKARMDRKTADIEKDYKIALAKGKNADVAKAKYEQRKADAADDYAKRTGADRSSTRAAESAAVSALKEARRTNGRSIQMRDTLEKNNKPLEIKSSTDSILKGLSAPSLTTTKKATPKATTSTRSGTGRSGTGSASAPRSTTGATSTSKTPEVNARTKEFLSKTSLLPKKDTGSGTPSTAPRLNIQTPPLLRADPKVQKQADARKAMTEARDKRRKAVGDFFGAIPTPALFGGSSKPKDTVNAAAKAAIAKGKDPNASGWDKSQARYYSRYYDANGVKKSMDGVIYKKGGKVKKYAGGGSVAPQPTAAERAESRKQDERLKKAKVTTKEGKVIDSANRSEGTMKKAKGGFMASKFGKALVKKSADTKGRAMMKKAGGGSCYAKGGSVSSRADGCAIKGKTKVKMV